MKLKSYPLIERGGVLWAFLGPADRRPPPPAYEWTEMPESHRYVSKRLQECNYLQAIEGGLDSIHSTFLHRYSVGDDPLLKRDVESAAMLKADPTPEFLPMTSPAGLHICTRRSFSCPASTFFRPMGTIPAAATRGFPWTTQTAWYSASTTTRAERLHPRSAKAPTLAAAST